MIVRLDGFEDPVLPPACPERSAPSSCPLRDQPNFVETSRLTENRPDTTTAKGVRVRGRVVAWTLVPLSKPRIVRDTPPTPIH